MDETWPKCYRMTMIPSLRLFRVMLEIEGLPQGRAFYDALLGIHGRSVGGARIYYDCSNILVGIVDVSNAEHKPKSMPQDLYFAVSSLEAYHRRAEKLGALSTDTVHDDPAGEIVRRPWGERSFYAIDPWGNGLCFVDEATIFTGA